MPAGHLAQATAAGQAVERRDLTGSVSSSGSIAFVAAGMSNTRQEFERFRDLDDPIKAGYVYSVNGAQTAQDAPVMATQAYWNVVDTRLTSAGLSPEQVGWIWIKQAVAAESGSFPGHAQTLQGYLKAAVLIIADRYPNCKGISFSSRVYGGYADIATSPEPWAYEGAFAVKWLIEDQIDGSDPDLAYGSVPVLVWGPYLWADGLTPRVADGLIWECDDFEGDGTHPGTDAEQKVADMLLDYMSDTTYMAWFSGQEAISEAALTSFTSDTDAASYATASITPTANALVVAFVVSRFSSAPNIPTLTGNGLTWVQINTVTFSIASATYRLSAFRAMGAAPSAGAVTIDFAGQTQLMCMASIMEFVGVDTGGTNGSSAVAQSATNRADGAAGVTVTLAATILSGSAVCAAFSNQAGSATIPDAGWSEVHDIQTTAPLGRLESQYNLTFDDTASGSQAPGTGNWAGIALEIAAATTPDIPDVPETQGPGLIIYSA